MGKAKIDIDDARIKKVAIEGTKKGLLLFALRLSEEMSLTLSQPGTGRVYRIGRGRTHRASAPGFPPAVRTGMLRRSYSLSMDGKAGNVGFMEWYEDVRKENIGFMYGTNVEYAKELEDPAQKNRPHLLPTLRFVEGQLPTLVNRGIADALTDYFA